MQKLKTLFANFQEEHGGSHIVAERLSQIYLQEGDLEKAQTQLLSV
ncbi:MAG: hypothetical protein HRT44_01030 [Bdellovibrionales bacterium]|nr:hypothetical protein [Bdellovibrionales bacterium]